MTFYNPIFIFVLITIIWFIPGILVRRYTAKKLKESKDDAQAKAIAKLYPKER
tara:strand:- start:217 stop:375 length:159 start_codon:yes stop_codon:yes gene_type:complete